MNDLQQFYEGNHTPLLKNPFLEFVPALASLERLEHVKHVPFACKWFSQLHAFYT